MPEKSLHVKCAGKVTVCFSDDSLENNHKIVLYWGVLPGNFSIQRSVAIFIVWINKHATEVATAEDTVLSVKVRPGNCFSTAEADDSMWPSLAASGEKVSFLALIRSCYTRLWVVSSLIQLLKMVLNTFLL